MFSFNAKIPLLIVHHRHQRYRDVLVRLSDQFDVSSIDHRDEIPFDTHPASILLCWKFQRGLLDRLPNLKWISALSAGVDHILQFREKLEDVLVTRASGSMWNFLAEYCLQHSLNYLKNHQRVLSQQSQKNWRFVKSKLLSRQAVAIYGMGSLGSEIARVFKVLGATVLGVKRSLDDTGEEKLLYCDALFAAEDIREPARKASVHILIMPETAETRGMFNADLLSSFTRGSLLINIGRGSLIVEEDLIAALGSGILSHAVLDVFNNEPLPDDHPFWNHEGITVTPHCAGPSEEVSLIEEFLEQFSRINSGEKPLMQVNFDKGY